MKRFLKIPVLLSLFLFAACSTNRKAIAEVREDGATECSAKVKTVSSTETDTDETGITVTETTTVVEEFAPSGDSTRAEPTMVRKTTVKSKKTEDRTVSGKTRSVTEVAGESSSETVVRRDIATDETESSKADGPAWFAWGVIATLLLAVIVTIAVVVVRYRLKLL